MFTLYLYTQFISVCHFEVVSYIFIIISYSNRHICIVIDEASSTQYKWFLFIWQELMEKQSSSLLILFGPTLSDGSCLFHAVPYLTKGSNKYNQQVIIFWIIGKSSKCMIHLSRTLSAWDSLKITYLMV